MRGSVAKASSIRLMHVSFCPTVFACTSSLEHLAPACKLEPVRLESARSIETLDQVLEMMRLEPTLERRRAV